MYIPPNLRCDEEYKINDLCDEFLHVDETPEGHIEQYCVGCNCTRKSVTCICILTDVNGNEVYSKVYKNKNNIITKSAIHAETFLVYDNKLRLKLDKEQIMTLYLTYQPCHFSGGHFKATQVSCTESLLHFHEKHLKSLNISLRIKFGYIYRAHWMMNEKKYDTMIANSNAGLRILLNHFEVEVLKEEDVKKLVKFFDCKTLDLWNSGYYKKTFQNRKKLERFIDNFLYLTKNL
jgi:hypothetical protein